MQDLGYGRRARLMQVWTVKKGYVLFEAKVSHRLPRANALNGTATKPLENGKHLTENFSVKCLGYGCGLFYLRQHSAIF